MPCTFFQNIWIMMSLEGGGGSCWKNARRVPDEEGISPIESGAVYDCGVLGRSKPTQFPRNPPHEICALGHKTGVGVGRLDRYTHIFVIYSPGRQQNCLECGVLKWSFARVKVWLVSGSAEGGPMEPSLTGPQSTNIISAWKNRDLLLKGYDKPSLLENSTLSPLRRNQMRNKAITSCQTVSNKEMEIPYSATKTKER